jgi:hypothetical protein
MEERNGWPRTKVTQNDYLCCLSIHSAIKVQITAQLNYWIFGLFPSSGVFGSRISTFRKLDVSLLRWRGEKTRWLRLDLSKRPIWVGILSTWRRKQIQFPIRRVSTPKNTGRWKKSKSPVILCAVHCRQNPIKSTKSTIVWCPGLNDGNETFRYQVEIMTSWPIILGGVQTGTHRNKNQTHWLFRPNSCRRIGHFFADTFNLERSYSGNRRIQRQLWSFVWEPKCPYIVSGWI